MGPFWTPITPNAGSLFHAEPQYGSAFNRQQDANRFTAALFGSATIGLGEHFDLTAGGRLHRERYSEDSTTSFFGAPPAVLDYSETYNEFLPSVGLTYNFTDTHSVFATARRGYNSGGSGVNFFTGATYSFDPEYVDTYEVGYRGEVADGKVLLTP